MPKLGSACHSATTTTASQAAGTALLLSCVIAGHCFADSPLLDAAAHKPSPLVAQVQHGKVHGASATTVISSDPIAVAPPDNMMPGEMKLPFPLRRPNGRFLLLVTLFAVLGGRELFARR